MRRLDRRRSLGLAAILLGLMVGCSGGGDGGSQTAGGVDDTSILQAFAEAYRMYSIGENRPPRNAEDIESITIVDLPTLEAINNGDLIVFWGTALPDLGEEPGQSSAPEILAYGKEVPEQGGYVLHLDRTISQMTPEQFQAAPKAGTVGSSEK